MPLKAFKPCLNPGCCYMATVGGYCINHVQKRDHAAKMGYDWHWQKVQKMKIAQDPMCEKGCGRSATVVHHVKHLKDHPELRFTMDNLQSLCRQCHEKIHGRL